MKLKIPCRMLRTMLIHCYANCAAVLGQGAYVRGKRLYKQWKHEFTFPTPEMILLKTILHSDDIVFDLGANIGEFTYALSTLISHGKIYSFEPQRVPFATLKGVCRKIGNAYPCNVGLSSSQCELKLYIPIVNGQVSPTEASLDSHFNDFTGYERRSKATGQIVETVRMTTLDAFLTNKAINRLDFVKIDVEGHELEVLKGASVECLRKQRPIFLIEVFPYVHQGHFDQVCSCLAQYDYIPLVISSQADRLEPLDRENLNNSPGFNYFFVPQEKTERVSQLLSESTSC